MSSSDINLLATSPVSRDKEKRLRQARIIAFTFIGIVGLASFFTFFLNISSPLEKIKKQEDSVLAQITSQQGKAAKLSIVSERGNVISKIYGSRPDYSGILSMVFSKASRSVRNSGLEIGESSIKVTVRSESLLDLNNFLNSVVDASRKNDKIASVFMDSLSASQTSSNYAMSLKINLKK